MPRTTRELVRLLVLVLGAASLVVVALMSMDDRLGQALSAVAVGCLVWAAVAEFVRQERARR